MSWKRILSDKIETSSQIHTPSNNFELNMLGQIHRKISHGSLSSLFCLASASWRSHSFPDIPGGKASKGCNGKQCYLCKTSASTSRATHLCQRQSCKSSAILVCHSDWPGKRPALRAPSRHVDNDIAVISGPVGLEQLYIGKAAQHQFKKRPGHLCTCLPLIWNHMQTFCDRNRLSPVWAPLEFSNAQLLDSKRNTQCFE